MAQVHGASIVRAADTPPGIPGEPYVISSQDGEVIYIPLSRSSTRLLVTGKESHNAFAIVGTSGSLGDPIGLHFHRETHDVFLCLKGNVRVWAGEQCRTLGVGDFASVPPNIIHQYQILGDHSEMMGLIVPGGWEGFFRMIGEPASGPFWPLVDRRDSFEILLPRLKAAAELFDMIPCPDHKEVAPSPWQAHDNSLPAQLAPYFLQNGSGPATLVGGTVCRSLITTAESAGRFAIASFEGSSHHREGDMFARGHGIKFADTHHAFLVVEGAVEFTLGSHSPALLAASEIIYVPQNTTFALQFRSRYAKFYTFASGAGLVELFARLGSGFSSPVPPEKAEMIDFVMLQTLQSDIGFVFG